MKGWSRSTIGVIIGVLSILLSFIMIIACIHFLADLGKRSAVNPLEQKEITSRRILLIVLLTFYSITINFSILLINGITMRRHKLMIPWLLFSVVGCMVGCGRLILQLFNTIIYGVSLSTVYTNLFANLIGIAISALITWFIYTVYKKIRKANADTTFERF